MRKLILSTILLALSAPAVLASHGIIIKPGLHGVPATVKRLVSVIEARGMTVFGRIDHAAGAAKAGQTLRPTTVILFGNPAVGTALMRCNQNVGLDLPLKILVREDAEGRTWISYSHPDFLADRYGLLECRDVLEKMAATLKEIVGEAAGDQP